MRATTNRIGSIFGLIIVYISIGGAINGMDKQSVLHLAFGIEQILRPMLGQCWSNGADVGSGLSQHLGEGESSIHSPYEREHE